MEYIVAKRFKRKGIDGNFNIPYNTILQEDNGFLMYNNKRICKTTSAVMCDYFANNDDNLGHKRYKITHQIINNMLRKDKESIDNWSKRWDILCQDNICNKYRKQNLEDFLWDISFYNAPLLDLYYILNLTTSSVPGGQKNVSNN